MLTDSFLQVSHSSQDSFRASGECHSLSFRCSGATSFNHHPPVALPGKTCRAGLPLALLSSHFISLNPPLCGW